MKWLPEDCAFGNIVRVKVGTIYHYGIYVSEEEVIQFGHAPTYYTGEHKSEPVLVCKTDVITFLNGGIIEVGIPTKKEKKSMFSPSETVSNARSGLGRDGYDLIHNNCEHFVYECAFGRKYSEQEEQLREKWNNRPRLSVYVSFEDEIVGEDYMPESREKEITAINNAELKADKIRAWKLLNFALKDCFNVDPRKIKFTKSKDGKWTAKGYMFSLSHTCGAVAVAVSNAHCGVDIESVTRFKKRFETEESLAAFANKIGEDSRDYSELLRAWTGKESVYKIEGKGSFSPLKIQFDKKDVKYVLIGDYVCAVAGAYSASAIFYKVENGKSAIFSKEECQCL